MHGHQPRKRFGQNFLVDPHYVARIVEAIAPQPGDRLVEIGPGLAALTRPLIERAGHLDAVEIDRDLAARLASDFASSQLTLHVADALEFDFATLGRALRIVGNLPYNISSPLLFRLAQFDALLVDVHVMLQKEVVARMTAQPGHAGIRAAHGDAAGALPDRAPVQRPGRRLSAGAQSRLRGRAARSAGRARSRTSPTSRCSAASSRRPSARGARRCATRSRRSATKPRCVASASTLGRGARRYRWERSWSLPTRSRPVPARGFTPPAAPSCGRYTHR